MPPLTTDERRWLTALADGRFGVWDLDPRREKVHYSPTWKERLGFPDAHAADSTSFWRCRVHPQDLAPMLDALRGHLEGDTATYEMRFRLRSNGSGYRQVLSRGRVIERDDLGRSTRMVGTMVDLTDRPATPCRLVATAPASAAIVPAPHTPFHQLLALADPHKDGLIARIDDLLDLALRETADAF